MHKPKRLALGLVAALALLAAGCGGAPAGSSQSSGASLVRADVPAFVAIDSDLGSAQWQQIDDLSHKFPSRNLAIAQIEQSLANDGIDYERDVKPALGPEVDLVFVSGGDVVLLTKPTDVEKFKALIAKANESESLGNRAVYREVDGWYAVGGSEAAIDRAVNGDSGKALSDESAFNDALGKLPGDALAKAYVNVQQLVRVLKREAGPSGNLFRTPSAGLDKLDSISASLSAEDDGIRVRGAVTGAGALVGTGDYSSKFLEEAPADALAFLTFQGGKGLGTTLQGVGAPLALLGISVDDLATLLEHETAVYVRPGAVIPEVTVVLDTPNAAAGLSTLDKLATRIAALTGGKLEGGAEKTIDLDRFAVHYGAADDKIVITSAPGGIAQYGKSSERLPDSADFKEAKAAAGLPDSNDGFLYVDLKDAIPMILGFAGLAGREPSPLVTENLRPLRAFVAWAAGSGDTRTFDAFLEIK